MLTASPRTSTLRTSLQLWFSRWGILDWLRLLWCAAVLWYELLAFLWSLHSCAWPDSTLSPALEHPAHVLLVADPQVRDLSTARVAGFGALRQYIVDLTLKRNWYFASRKKPDVVVFLGDMLASWRSIKSDEDYAHNYNHFTEIFRIDRHTPTYFVPGNNDVGLNIEPGTARVARQRFTTHFGPLNQMIVIHNHTLVMLDAAGLVEEDYQRSAKYVDYDHWTPLPRGPVEFVHSLRAEGATNSTILLTHIPLHRPDTASCGPLREKGTIRRGVGPSYQSMLGKKTTAFLLRNLAPQIVFSADDKDYCDYIHIPPRDVVIDPSASSPEDKPLAKPQNVREITLKAFSPSPEIRRPGFQLLSLVSPSSHPVPLATTACFLPDYPSVYAWRYLPLLLITILTLVFLRRRKMRLSPLPTHLHASSLHKSFSLHSLPSAPWSPQLGPHPPTPFSTDWSPHTPGFFSPHARPRSPKSSPASPQEEIPKSALRSPLPNSLSLSAMQDRTTGYLPTTPTFRATAIPRAHPGDGHEPHMQLPTGPAHLEVDEADEGDEFGYGYGLGYGHQPLRVKLDRPNVNTEDYEDDEAGSLDSPDEFALNFTLYGRRRRFALWIPLLTGWSRTRGRGSAGLRGRRRGVRAFLTRVGLDVWYVLWPAGGLWIGLAWLMS